MPKYKFDYYLKSIDRRWKKEVNKATGKVIILSPYITSNTAAIILNNLNIAKNSEIYTVFSVKNFVSGGSSIKTLRLLQERGFQLYHLPRLHAKMLIVSGKFASIGSQNLTNNGVRNKEASIVIYDSLEVDKIMKLVNKWLMQKQKISNHMIEKVEKNLLSLRRKICPIWRESNDLEIEIWQDEAQRLEKEQIKTKQKLEMQSKKKKQIGEPEKFKILLQKDQKWQQILDEAKNRVIQIAEFENVDRSVAEKFIANSVYWYDHPCGRPVEAPGHINNIYGSEKNWRIDFGANTFLISNAIVRCQKKMILFLDRLDSGYYINLIDLRNALEFCLRSAVANYEGHKYESLYPLVEDKYHNKYMKFGSQAIRTDYFINEIFKLVKLRNINLFIQHNYKLFVKN